MQKICCFGELLLRFSPDLQGEWLQNAALPVFLGGAELNVATALALWDVPVKYVSAAPDNYVSRQVTDEIRKKRISADDFIYAGSRIGTYFLPQGKDLKNAGVIYDRAYSSFASLATGEVKWDKVLQDVSWFHITAINPALTEQTAAVCKEGLQEAVNRGITTSVDLNYRAKLWQYGKQPVDVMPELVQYCDVVMGNIWAAEKMLGIPLPPDLKDDKDAYLAQAEKTSRAIQQQYPRCRQVANTFRFDQGAGIKYYATLFKDNTLYVAQEHQAAEIVDKIGSGDCFMAGLIYSNYHQLPGQEVIDFAAAAAFTKLFIKGDATTASVQDIKKRLLHHA